MVDFMDDKQLLGELKRGNNAAFEFLFKSYYPRLRGYAIRFIEDEETVRQGTPRVGERLHAVPQRVLRAGRLADVPAGQQA